jgi:hypothetical protein
MTDGVSLQGRTAVGTVQELILTLIRNA